MKLIAKKFGFEYPLHPEVKKVDNDMLQAEWDCLILGKAAPAFATKDNRQTKEDFLLMFNYYSKTEIEKRGL